jgi:hypothetical protein
LILEYAFGGRYWMESEQSSCHVSFLHVQLIYHDMHGQFFDYIRTALWKETPNHLMACSIVP